MGQIAGDYAIGVGRIGYKAHPRNGAFVVCQTRPGVSNTPDYGFWLITDEKQRRT
jgi:hypothetical protein